MYFFCFWQHTTHMFVFSFFFYMGRWQLHRERVEACGGVQKGSVNGLGKFMRLWRRGKTIRLSSQSSRVRNPAPLCFVLFCSFPFCFFFFFSPLEVVSSVCMFVFFCFATYHQPVITTSVLRGFPTLRAHSAHTHRPGAHGLLEVPLHLLPSPAKLFQRRIRVQIRQVIALQSSLALSPLSVGIPDGLPSGSSTQSDRCTPAMWGP